MKNVLVRWLRCGLFAGAALLPVGCAHDTGSTSAQARAWAPSRNPAEEKGVATTAATGRHSTAHNGVLNAIVKCEIGHVEVKKESDVLQVWFVDGSTDTTKSVPIKDSTVVLKVTRPGGKKTQTLTLSPRPLDLAGETVGNCSRFAGRAPWLSGITTFTATGNVTFKGQKQPLRIEYPKGYDPD